TFTSYFRLPTSDFLLPTSYFRLQTSYFRLPTSDPPSQLQKKREVKLPGRITRPYRFQFLCQFIYRVVLMRFYKMLYTAPVVAVANQLLPVPGNINVELLTR